MSHRRFLELALAGDRPGARVFARALLEQGWSLERLYLECFQPALIEVGERWLANELSVADEHLVSAIVEGLIAETSPLLPSPDPEAPVALLASVQGEDHRIGQLIVGGLWTLAGWQVIGLGSDVPVDSLVPCARRFGARLVGLSVTMRHHLPVAADAIRRLKAAPGLEGVSVLLGGAAFAGQEARDFGADGLPRDGWEALDLARALIARSGAAHAG